MRKMWLKYAEVIDAYRVFPRILIIAWMWSVGLTLHWYIDFPTYPIIQCSENVFNAATQAGASIAQAESIACRQTGVVDRPAGYTALLSVLIGASAGVFGLYTNTGRKWDNAK
jgi:hypothetical protein